jgi:hypothetical protein
VNSAVNRLLFFGLLLAVLGGWHWWSSERAIERPPGIIAPEEPVQVNLDPPPRFEARGYTFIERATYTITARVLRKEIYRLDGGAALAPVDLGVGWGPLSDSALIDQLEFSQMGRFFYWTPRKADFPLPAATLISHLAQMHMIPATRAIETKLRQLRPGELVTASGYLVDVRGANGFSWNTSLSRTDTGEGACELFWVERLETD